MREITIPIEDGAIPDGWEPVRIGLANAGETVAGYSEDGKATAITLSFDLRYSAIIIRKIYDPGIRLHSGWWVWRTDDNWIASKGVETWGDAVCGLQFLPGFIPPEDGQPRKIT